MTSDVYDDTASKAVRDIKKTLRRLVIATVVLFVGLVSGVLYTWSVSRNNQKALCTYRADVEARIQQGELFLIEHPRGVQGISPEAIKQGLDNQRRVAAAFQDVNCKGINR